MELKEMVFHDESSIVGKPLFQLAQLAAYKVDDHAALGAYEVVVVLRRPPEQVTAGVSFVVHLADEPHSGQHLKRAIYGDQSDAGMFTVRTFIKLGGGDVVVAFSDGVYHCPALGCQFVAFLF